MRPSAPPNILWIVTTQWRAQACGFAGDPNARTPHLDALAARSVNYAQAVTPHPFGPFARAALLTGVASPQNGVRDYFDPLPMHARTIARTMEERGYATGFFGKWHLGARDPNAALVGEVHAKTMIPAAARGGFEFWEGFEGGFQLNDPWLHGSRLPEPTCFPGYQPRVLVERFAGWQRERLATDPRPWFCVLSFETPHPPYDAAAEGIARAHPNEIVLLPNVPADAGIAAKARSELAGYYAHITATDRCVGALMAELNSGRTKSDTVVVFTSVHGDMHGAHGLFRKGWPHEESVRVPLLVASFGLDAPTVGLRSEALVSLLDLPRWTTQWADGVVVDDHPGKQHLSMPSVVRLPHQCDRVWRGVRTRTRKLIVGEDRSPWLFFDLQQDPFETRNLAHAAERAEEIADLTAMI